MRLVRILATLCLALSLAGGVPPAHACEGGADARDFSTTQEAINLQASHAGDLSVEATAWRESARSSVTTARRSLGPLLGIVPGGIVVPALVLSGTLALARGDACVLDSLLSSSVRGPPLTV